jgi:hypothetical protein
MARALARERRGAKANPTTPLSLESPALLTLGILYEETAASPAARIYRCFRSWIVSRRSGSSPRCGVAKERRAIADIDRRVGTINERLKARGFRSPYLRAYVVARVNPVRWTRKAGQRQAPDAARRGIDPHGTKHPRDFDVGSVKSSELAVIAAVAPPKSIDALALVLRLGYIAIAMHARASFRLTLRRPSLSSLAQAAIESPAPGADRRAGRGRRARSNRSR